MKIYNYKKEPYEQKHYRNKYIYTQNYELKCTIKYITIAYISELLKLLIFQKYKIFFLSLYNARMVKVTRKEKNTNTKIRSILRLLSAHAGYIKRKVTSIYKKFKKNKKNW